MKLTAMRYKSYVWPNNPRSLRLGGQKEIKEHMLPGKGSAAQHLGDRARTAEVSGEFFGTSAFVDYARLAAIFRQKQAGQLVIPGMEPFFAYFLSLEMIGKPGPSIIGYRCVFLEEPSSVLIALPAVTSCTVGADENLWEIAGRYGVSPERLLELNSWIRDPFELKEGREVKLA